MVHNYCHAGRLLESDAGCMQVNTARDRATRRHDATATLRQRGTGTQGSQFWVYLLRNVTLLPPFSAFEGGEALLDSPPFFLSFSYRRF